MSKEKATCQICGEPMPPGEEMFNYHGFSGNCPKSPQQKPQLKSIIEYFFRQTKDGQFWIEVHADRQPYSQIGPFSTESERQRAYDDLLEMTRSCGARDMKEQ